jgi:hypothetical protein
MGRPLSSRAQVGHVAAAVNPFEVEELVDMASERKRVEYPVRGFPFYQRCFFVCRLRAKRASSPSYFAFTERASKRSPWAPSTTQRLSERQKRRR